MCATDAGREGELIFRYIYEAAGCLKPFSRLVDFVADAGRHPRGFRRLRTARHTIALADAARGRSRADWLVGMNLSRAYSLAYGDEELSVGRVQTPTLAMLVERELAIRAFVPEDYLEVVAHILVPSARRRPAYQGTWFREPARDSRSQMAMRLPADGAEAGRIVGARAHGRGRHRIHRIAKRSACRRRCSTISPNCSGTPIACSASARRRRSKPRRRFTRTTS